MENFIFCAVPNTPNTTKKPMHIPLCGGLWRGVPYGFLFKGNVVWGRHHSVSCLNITKWITKWGWYPRRGVSTFFRQSIIFLSVWYHRVLSRLWVGLPFPLTTLTLSWRRPLSYRNQSIDLRSKSMDRFLYDNGLRHERVKLRTRPHQYTKTLQKIS